MITNKQASSVSDHFKRLLLLLLLSFIAPRGQHIQNIHIIKNIHTYTLTSDKRPSFLKQPV